MFLLNLFWWVQLYRNILFCRFDHTPLATPNGDILIKDLTFEVKYFLFHCYISARHADRKTELIFCLSFSFFPSSYGQLHDFALGYLTEWVQLHSDIDIFSLSSGGEVWHECSCVRTKWLWKELPFPSTWRGEKPSSNSDKIESTILEFGLTNYYY